jgi:hypothetical protein
MRHPESWLDLLTVQRPMLIPNDDGEGHRCAGIARPHWLNSHCTRPDTGRLERRPLRGRNRPLGAADERQHQDTHPRAQNHSYVVR